MPVYFFCDCLKLNLEENDKNIISRKVSFGNLSRIVFLIYYFNDIKKINLLTQYWDLLNTVLVWENY